MKPPSNKSAAAPRRAVVVVTPFPSIPLRTQHFRALFLGFIIMLSMGMWVSNEHLISMYSYTADRIIGSVLFVYSRLYCELLIEELLNDKKSFQSTLKHNVSFIYHRWMLHEHSEIPHRVERRRELKDCRYCRSLFGPFTEFRYW